MRGVLVVHRGARCASHGRGPAGGVPGKDPALWRGPADRGLWPRRRRAVP